MKTIFALLLMLLASCASRLPMNELMAEANQCVLEYNENGVIKPTPDEYKDECWEEVNRRLDAEIKRDAKRRSACGEGMVEYCDWRGCGCVTRARARYILTGERY